MESPKQARPALHRLQGMGTAKRETCFGARMTRMTRKTSPDKPGKVTLADLEEQISDDGLLPWRLVPYKAKDPLQSHVGGLNLIGGPVTEAEIAAELTTLPVFQCCSKNFVIEIAGYAAHHLLAQGEFILRKGSNASSMFVLGRGEATVFLDCEGNEPCAVLLAGTYVGELSMLGLTTVADYTVQAREDCSVLEIPQVAFERCLKLFPEEEGIFNELMKKCGALVNQVFNWTEACEIFGALSYSAVEHLKLARVHKVYFPNEYMMMQGAPGKDLLFLEAGEVSVEIDEKEVWKETPTLGPVCFGELGLLGIQEKRTASIIAKSSCFTSTIFHSSFLEILQAQNEGFQMDRVAKFLAERYHDDGGASAKKNKRFKDIDFFKSAECSDSFLEHLEQNVEERVYLVGQFILDRDAVDDRSMYVLTHGKVAVLRGDVAVTTLDGGSVFGEAVLLGLTTKRTVAIKAAATCYVQVLHQDVVIKGLELFPDERQKLLMTAFKKKNKMEMREERLEAMEPAASQKDRNSEHNETRRSTTPGESPSTPRAKSNLSRRLSRSSTKDFPGASDTERRRGSVSKHQSRGPKQASSGVSREYNYFEAVSSEVIVEDIDEAPPDEWKRNNMDTILKALRSSSLFSGIDESFVESLSRVAIDRIFMPGERIIEEGSEGDSMFVMVSGKANVCVTSQGKDSIEGKVKRNTVVVEKDENDVIKKQNSKELYRVKTSTKTYIGVLEAGSICGELAMLGIHSKRSATIEAETICCLWEVHHNAAVPILARYPDIQESFLNTIIAHLEHTVPSTIDAMRMFAPFGRKFRMLLGLYCERRAYFHGCAIFTEGASGAGLYILNHGQACLECKGMLVQSYNAGTPFNAAIMLGIAKTCMCTLIAFRTCHVVLISRSSFQQALEQYPARNAAQELKIKETAAYESFRRMVQRHCSRKLMWKERAAVALNFSNNKFREETSTGEVVLRRFFGEWQRLLRWRKKLRKQEDHARSKFDHWVRQKRLADTPMETSFTSAYTSWGIAEPMTSPRLADTGSTVRAPISQYEGIVSSTISTAVPSPVHVPKLEKNAHLFNLYLSDPRLNGATIAPPTQPSSCPVSPSGKGPAAPASARVFQKSFRGSYTPKGLSKQEHVGKSSLTFTDRDALILPFLPSLVMSPSAHATQDLEADELWVMMGGS